MPQLPLHRDHPVLLDREREPAVLERDRLLAEHLAPPAFQRRHVGVVARRRSAPGRRPSRSPWRPRRCARRSCAAGPSAARASRCRSSPAWLRSSMRQRLRIAREPALHRLENLVAPFRALEALRAASADPASFSSVVGACTARSPITSSLSTRPRGTSRACASRSRHAATSISTASSLRLAHARLQPLPRMLRLHAVGVGRGEDLHLLVDPLGAPALGDVGGQRAIDVAQMRHVGDRVFELRRRSAAGASSR